MKTRCFFCIIFSMIIFFSVFSASAAAGSFEQERAAMLRSLGRRCDNTDSSSSDSESDDDAPTQQPSNRFSLVRTCTGGK